LLLLPIVSIFKSNKNKIGHVIQLIFKITQHKKDKNLLELIAKFLNCGAVYSHSENAYVFKGANFENIIKIIIPKFKLYPITREWNQTVRFSRFL
jgi:hypothetical protein